jgi:hypothetical protein
MLYTITQLGFILLTLLFFYLLLKTFAVALAKASLPAERQQRIIRIVTITLIIWAVLVSILSQLGMIGNFELFPFNIAPLLFIPLISILFFTFSKTMTEILTHLQPHQLIRLQVFRVFVEVLLWMLFIQNLLPVQMSFEGRNFDILAGITAPIVAWLAHRNKVSKTFLVLWNIACLGLLINIVTIAILSMPTPFQYFTNEPSNTIVTVFPIVLLPTFLVPLAYMLHFFSLRQLLMKSPKSV